MESKKKQQHIITWNKIYTQCWHMDHIKDMPLKLHYAIQLVCHDHPIILVMETHSKAINITM